MVWPEAAGAPVQSSSSRSHHAGRQWRGQAAGGCCCWGFIARWWFFVQHPGCSSCLGSQKQQQRWLTSGIRAHQSLWTVDCVATSLSSSAPVRCLVAARHPRVSGGTTGGNWLGRVSGTSERASSGNAALPCHQPAVAVPNPRALCRASSDRSHGNAVVGCDCF